MLFSSLASAALALFSLPLLASAATYSNPLKQPNGGDPSIVYHNGYYYIMTTTWSYLEITRATTLEGLKSGETKTIWQPDGSDTCCNVWAPEMHLVDGSWYVYFSAGNNAGAQRPQVLKGGLTPWDAYTRIGTINTPDWAIDGTLLTVKNKRYFVYSCFRNDTGARLQSLCIAEMKSATTIGPEFLLSSPTASWETARNPVNEGPFALYNRGRTFLSFSASDCWTPNYALGILEYTKGDPLQKSSWVKTGPVFSSANQNFGTGHNSFFKSPNGNETWMAYHSTPNSAGSCGNRNANAKKIGFTADGFPDLGQATPYGQVLPGPAGEK